MLETGFALRPLTALVIGEGTAGFGRDAAGWPDQPVAAWRMSSSGTGWQRCLARLW
ncbi:hypothetical protein ACFCV3_37955 [Kribbella sp. NPDC056345]|uniref:hypothetical protein n=1 Tax=Kribbella sp. NPDC056345 TaxID=3345789 RepID=UPI0035DDD1B3